MHSPNELGFDDAPNGNAGLRVAFDEGTNGDGGTAATSGGPAVAFPTLAGAGELPNENTLGTAGRLDCSGFASFEAAVEESVALFCSVLKPNLSDVVWSEAPEGPAGGGICGGCTVEVVVGAGVTPVPLIDVPNAKGVI